MFRARNKIFLLNMLRTTHLSPFSSPSFFLPNLRLPLISSSSLPFSPLRTPCYSSLPLLHLPRLFTPTFSPPSSCSLFIWNPFMGTNPRPSGKVWFSAGNGDLQSKEILVQHLLVGGDDLQLLVELQKRISGGEDLSDLATEFSICPSKEIGGMLGWVRRGQMIPEFEQVAFTAPLNKVVRCKSKYGWHLLQVLSEREESLLEDIGPEEFYSKMQDPSFVEAAQLIDVREPEEVDIASLPGFKVLPLRQFGTWGSLITDEFNPQKDIYVLCHHGVRSMQVAKWLQTQGFKKVFNIAGGIHAYAVKADPSIPTY
ncbi:Peptidylprolyl isomerase protein [Dioscorea alata]|uniref:Peptidylprolyl isomerase protein n=1 Tax=Dioscorea alata TaxID=55571 RepID=A0ACB7VS05_DIOAL|nr:Peptidylprolyl isomerase protein [Dioscorea alata]